jgi:transposase, IS30 family
MSWKHLTQEERYQIEAMLRAHSSQAEIARALGRHPSTISRELKRNPSYTPPSLGFVRTYVAKNAIKQARERRIEKGANERKIVGELARLVDQKLRLGWSPEHISGRLRGEMGITLSHETIYQYIIRDNALHPSESKGLRYALRFHGYKRHRFKKSRMAQRTRARKNWIDQRPAGANDRTELGHWERDSLLGKRGESALLTIVDRRSRYLLVRHVARLDTDTVARETIAALKPHRRVTKTVTNDNGVEFQRDEQLQRALKVPVYYTEPSCPWQRGSVENANGLLRQYMHKGASFDKLPTWVPRALEETLNFRPRKVLGYRTPHEVFYNQQVKLMSGPLLRLGLETSRNV